MYFIQLIMPNTRGNVLLHFLVMNIIQYILVSRVVIDKFNVGLQFNTSLNSLKVK